MHNLDKITNLTPNLRGSTIGLAGRGIWLILRARFGMRVKNRSGKRDFKYGRERGRDAVIVRYSMAGYRITIMN